MGEPLLIRTGDIIFGQTTATGSLFVESQAPRSSSAISLGTLDQDGRVVGWKPLSLSGGYGDPNPSWSPDSRQIAYVTRGVAGGRATVYLRNIDSGADRELYSGRLLSACVWAAQRPELYCGERPDLQTSEIISIAVDSGRVERLASPPGQVFPRQPSRDDSALYLIRDNVLDASRVLRKWGIGSTRRLS